MGQNSYLTEFQLSKGITESNIHVKMNTHPYLVEINNKQGDRFHRKTGFYESDWMLNLCWVDVASWPSHLSTKCHQSFYQNLNSNAHPRTPVYTTIRYNVINITEWSCRKFYSTATSECEKACHPSQHITGHFRDRFYRQDDPTVSKYWRKLAGHEDQTITTAISCWFFSPQRDHFICS